MKLPALPNAVRALIRRATVTALLGLAASARAQTPVLQATPETAGGVRLSWTNTAPGYVLEETPALSATPVWSPVTTPAVDPAKATVWPVGAGSGERFYRLRANEATGLTTIVTTSPGDREPGVSVNREVVLNFSQPLAADTLVTTTNFFAGSSGRKFLARVELASDRHKASLFFLEPIRGSTRISVVFDGTGLRDSAGRLLDADGDGKEGGSRVFTYDTYSTVPIPGTAVTGQVFASERGPGGANLPLPGVTITVDGAEESLRAVTDEAGRFQLTNAPAGRFFVHIDGRTSPLSHWPTGDYYPFVGKAWEAVPGREDNLAGGTGLIYLPLVSAATLQPTSPTQDTVIGFPDEVLAAHPELAGVSLTVPAGALFDDNGTRGGRVGIAPVPPDRLPGPLPFGFNPPLVITVQTDGGQNFDRPVPICFPNVPDAIGFTPLPGMKTALVSFDHDIGEWQIVASMTVSADGLLICSDPGSGILKPGWHGRQFPNPDDNPGPPPKPAPPLPPAPECNQPQSSGPPVAGLQASADGGAIARHTPRREDANNCNPPCNPKTQSDGRHKCKIRCVEDMFIDCGITVGAAAGACAAYTGGAGLAPCAAAAAAAAAPCLLIKYTTCRSRCDEDNPPCNSTPSSGARPAGLPNDDDLLPEDPAFTEVMRLLQLLATLGQPYVDDPLAMPADQVKQAEALLAQLSSLTEGDLQGFFQRQLVESERKAVQQFGDTMEVRGDQPESPLFLAYDYYYEEVFVARIAGTPDLTTEHIISNGPRTERQLSGAFAQYRLFLPGMSSSAFRAFRSSNPNQVGLFRIATLRSVRAYDPVTKRVGQATPRRIAGLPSGISGFRFVTLPRTTPDSDGDGLPDYAEEIIGTDRLNPDSDGDGLKDGAELDQGNNPLDGRPASVGIQATIKGTGTTYDVAAFNDVAITAEGIAGVGLFNVSRGYNPVFVGTVATPGDARAVALGNAFAAVGGGTGGLSLLRVSSDAGGRLLHTLLLGSAVNAVAAHGGLAFAGTDAGEVVLVEALSGLLLGRVQTGQRVNDLGFSDGHLFVLTEANLAIFRLEGLDLVPVTTVPHGNSYQVESITGRRRLAVGGGQAWVTGYPGFSTLSVTNPALPFVLGSAVDYAPNSFKQVAPTGSGYGVAAVGVVPSNVDPRTHNVQLFNLRDPSVSTNVITQFDTPGLARAVALYGGLAYVADSESGLQVMSYLPFDTGTNAPTIALNVGATGELLEAGQTLGLTASVTDDVQVREVEFYLNGQRVLVDGGFPFEVGVQLPAYDANRTNVTVRARAIDTGGNATWSDELRFGLSPDRTPPKATPLAPAVNGAAGNVRSVALAFNEPVEPDSASARLEVRSSGLDGALGTADDQPVAGTFVLRNDGTTAFLNFSQPLPSGHYLVRLAAGVTDRSGNATAKAVTWNFRALNGEDSDQDGMLDAFELQYGFDPASSDGNRNGVADGLEDADGDGIANYVEMLLGLNPRDAFTFPPTRDNELDRDGDYLLDAREGQFGTDPLKPDTDGDLFTDEAEVTAGTDPLNPRSYPLGVRLAAPELQATLITPRVANGLFVFGQPPIDAVNVSSAVGRIPFIMAQPPVNAALMFTAGNRTFVHGGPPVEAVQVSTVGRLPFTLGQPPVEVFAPGRSPDSAPQFFFGWPPIEAGDEPTP